MELLQLPHEGAYIFPGKSGEPMRHTAGTLLAQTTDLGTLMEILGHSNPKTAKRYINPSQERKREAVNQVANLIKKL